MPVCLLLLLLLSTVSVAAQPSPASVGLVDALAAATTASPEVALASEAVALERANLRAAESAFETQVYAQLGGGQSQTPLTALQQASVGSRTSGSGYAQYEAGASRRFRSGLQLAPLVRVTRTDAEGTLAAVETQALLSLTYPVLGARSRDVTVAQEKAAYRRIAAADLDRTRTAEVAALQVAVAYWDYVGAGLVRDALVSAEGRAARLLEETEALVEADERPAADLVPLRADLARRRAARLGAEQSLFDARQRLGLAMGGSAELATSLGTPADALPTIPASIEADEAALMSLALDARVDLRAADARLAAVERELGARRWDRRPSVDIVVEGGYRGLSEDVAGPQHYLPVGLNSARGTQFGVTLRLNRLSTAAADAAFQQSLAQRERARIARDDLARRVRADVSSALAALRSAAAEVAQTREAVALYEEAVENERRRLRLSMGTLFDVQIVEERLANAQTQAVQAEVRYAQALASLHAATGTLIGTPEAAAARIRTIPSL
ncbi:MAG: TolC family protein [Bacteroidota bacterium]